MKGISINAHGKINLFLDCIGKRKDGYHEVKMIMQSVRLHDRITIQESPKNVIFSDSPYVPNNKNNLAMKAAMLLQKKYNIPTVSINIKKHIPVSAGMAGGSTDAAAVLNGCNQLFQVGLSEQHLMQLAAQIGSDVPFCVKGGTAIAEGRGEKITPLPQLPKMHVILVRADYGVSTASVYKELRIHDLVPQEKLFSRLCDAIAHQNTAFVEAHLYNILEKPSFRIEPRTYQRKNKMEEEGIKHLLMSGSGPTIFAIYESEEEAWISYKKIKQLFPYVYLTSTCGSDLINSRLIF